MNSIKISLVLFCICLAAGICDSQAHESKGSIQKTGLTKHFRETFFAISEKAEFSIEILPDEKEYRIGRNVIGIVIHNKHDEDVEDAVIDIIIDGSSNKPVVKEKGAGLYIVSDLDLKREGVWKLTIRVRGKSDTDQVSFVFPAVVKKFLPPGRYDTESLKEKQ